MAVKVIFLCIIQILIFYCTISDANPILGRAEPANIDEFPFIVSLSHFGNIIDKDNHFCGGALISKKHVLTAEHCIKGLRRRDVVIIVGTTDFSSGQVYRIKSWITYDYWVLLSCNRIPEAMDNDIAIITLMQDVINIEPAKISPLAGNELVGKSVVTAGWGSTNGTNETNYPLSLLKVMSKVLNDAEIRKNEYALFKVVDNPLSNFYYTSADPPAMLGCGDSGGPLLLKGSKEIVGVNSASSNCGVVNPQNFKYTMSLHLKLLNKYKKFIEDTKKQ